MNFDDFVMVRGVKVEVDKSAVNKDFHLRNFKFCIDKLKIYHLNLLSKIVWHKYTPTINGNLLGKVECVFDIFAQYYGNFRFCIIGKLQEQAKVKETIQFLDYSVEFVKNVDEIEPMVRKNPFVSIVYFPNDGMMFDDNVNETEVGILEQFDFQTIQAVEATEDFFKNYFKQQYSQMKKRLEEIEEKKK